MAGATAGRGRLVKGIAAALIALAALGVDQAAKAAARESLPGRGTVSVVGSVVVLRYAENTGAFLGLGGRLPRPLRLALLVALPAAAVAGMGFALARSRALPWRLIAGLALVAGGGVGNLVDRVTRDGRVTDFLNVGIGGLRTGIFNVADLAVLAGCVLLVLAPAAPRAAAGPGPSSPTS